MTERACSKISKIRSPGTPCVIAGVMVAALFAADAGAQPQPACEQGVIQLPANINGKVTLCSQLAAQLPALARQLEEITKALGNQKSQLDELNRLIRGVNGISQNIGIDRQTALVRNLFAQLQVSQRVGAEQTERQIAALADGFDRLKDQLFSALTNKTTSARASAAIEGPLGDAIAQLDLNGAEQVLADIRTQLQAIGGQVAEVNQRTAAIQKTLEQQRMEVPRIGAYLAAADVSSLQSVSASGLQASVLEEGWQQPAGNGKSTAAARFFENSRESRPAMEWLDSALAAGADPTATVPNDYYGREGLLLAAMRAGNAPAMKTLLRRGASPHAYQDLFLTSYAQVRFLFPLAYIADDSRLTLEQKQDLAKAFLEAGVVIPKVVQPTGGTGWPSVMHEVQALQKDVASKLGMSLPPSERCCTHPEPICKHASQRFGEDWCAVVAAIPKKLLFDLTESHSTSAPIYDIELEYLLAIDRTKAYFLGLVREISWDYVLVEVSKDASNWTVFHYMPPAAGMGLCKIQDKDRPEYCWRRIALQRVAGKSQMRFESSGLVWTITDR